MGTDILDPRAAAHGAARAAPLLSLEGIEKSFGGTKILKRLDLDAYDGEFLSFLGPSGCGKTTMLRTIAGFERPDRGRVVLGGVDITGLPPNRRNVSTVFQDYALFPHMSVAENVAFGLVERRMAKADIAVRVGEMLEMVRLRPRADHKPSQLSGGQRQRVALARALAVRPRILLLDEPLGALDLKLRRAMQVELRGFQRRLGITFIYVTHDQEEALTMSDRIVVMQDGEVQQVGDARSIYERPGNRFVADFIGETTLLPVTVAAVDPITRIVLVEVCGDRLAVAQAPESEPPVAGEACLLSLRPEKVRIVGEADSMPSGLDASVETTVFRGAMQEVVLRLRDGTTLRASAPPAESGLEPGRRVRATWSPAAAVLLRH